MQEKKKKGRPTKYNEKLAKKICLAIATTSKSITKLCAENPNWPHRATIFEWTLVHDEFHDMYTRARIKRVEAYSDDIIDISDDADRDTLIKYDSHGETYEVENREWVNRSRLRVDSRKWFCSKLAPKIYGDNLKENDIELRNDNETTESGLMVKLRRLAARNRPDGTDKEPK